MASRSFGICLRTGLVSMFALWLSGCGLPPALTIMTSAFDGISFITVGKSLPDLALSAMTDMDCAVYRVVTNTEVCRETIGDRDPAAAIVASDTVEDTSDSFYMLRHGGEMLTATVAELTTGRVLLEGFADRTELFALIQDDGTLEVFAHEPGRARDRSNMRLIVRISGHAGAPESITAFRLNGANLAVEDIIV